MTSGIAVGDDLADARETLREAETGFAKSAAEKNLDRFRSYIAEDAIFLGGSGAMRGRDAVVDGWSVFFAEDAVPIEWEPRDVEVQDSGKLGMTRGPYWIIRMNPDGGRERIQGTFTSVWRREEDGSWKVIFDGGSPPCSSTATPVE